MAESHTDGVTKGEFCALRTDKCDCGNEYQENCKPGWSYIKYPQKYTRRIKEFGVSRLESRRRSYEAHHLLCVASVTKIIAKDEDVAKIVEQTKWCINHKDNMIALPMWCHTLRWYCSMVTGELREATLNDGSRVPALGPPPFKNLTQHDYDHGCYIDEIDTDLKDILNRVNKNKKAHKHRKKQLKDELNKLVRSARGRLQRRGNERCGGTHKAWKQGMNDRDSDWYLPFSMAATGDVEPRTFPASGDSSYLSRKINDMVNAFFAGGG